VSALAKYTTNPGMLHWKALLRVLGYLCATQEYCIKYKRNEAVVEMALMLEGTLTLPFTTMDGFVDASYAGDADTRISTTGYLFNISGRLVSWQSRIQSTVALPNMEAEYMATSAATQEAMWLNWLLQQLGLKPPYLPRYMRIIRRRSYVQTILVITGEASTSILEDTL
jgi:hypothetical protein